MTINGNLSDKMVDIKLFIEKNNVSLLGIIESDIHGPNSPANRSNTFKKEDIIEQLSISGYTIYLPDTWNDFHQARLIVFARDDIKVKKRNNPYTIKDLPNMTFEVGIGRERKSLINFYYREWTGGLTADKSHAGQLDRFSRQVQYWRDLKNENKDLVLLGDANFCYQSCFNSEYPTDLRAISNLATYCYLEESISQLI